MLRFFGRKRIYLDHASATPLHPDAARAMRHAETFIGNPGAIHAEGVEAKRALERAREDVAHELGVKAREVIFTSGLTEANNLGILGYARKLEFLRTDLTEDHGRSLEGTHWLVSSTEHASVLECFAEVECLGGSVEHIGPNPGGVILPETVAHALRKETVFVSIGWANNEIGTIQPLGKIAGIIRVHESAHKTSVIFHSDAGQAPLYSATSVHSLGVDLLSLGSAKLYGPHGAGALYLNDRVRLAPVIMGGAQERGLRAGTENVALAVGFAAAFCAVARERGGEAERLGKLRDELARELVDRIPGLVVNGDLKRTLPHMLNISVPDISVEYLTLALDHAGISISTKSACREGEESRSHVVEALGGVAWRAQNTLRISLGRDTSESDIRRVSEEIVSRIART